MVQKNLNSKNIFIVVGILVLISIIFLLRKPRNIIKLDDIEVEEYQGEKLGSIFDFRENSIKGPQHIDVKDYNLNIDGLVDKKLSLTYDQVLAHTRYNKMVTLNCVEGWSVKVLWEGILLKDLLNQVEIKQGSNTVIFHAVDGYSSSLPLDFILNNNILLAYKINGVTLPSERGFPFQVVAENKWGYKWVKWINRIEISSDPNYKGYWEKSGYNQNGDLNGPIFEP